MRDIYQKAQKELIWLGEERPYAEEAMQNIPILAKAFDSLGTPFKEFGFGSVKINEPSEVPSG
jgi:hypothetical protein